MSDLSGLLSIHLFTYLFMYFCDSSGGLYSVCRLTGEDFARAAGDGHQVLDQVLAVGGLATARLSQHHNGLILPGGEQVAVGRLGHRVDVRCRVITPTAFEHVHHLMGEREDAQSTVQIL